MENQKYYVITPTTLSRKKVMVGDELELSEKQARPLRMGGFITIDKLAAEKIKNLLFDIDVLAEELGAFKSEKKLRNETTKTEKEKRND